MTIRYILTILLIYLTALHVTHVSAKAEEGIKEVLTLEDGTVIQLQSLPGAGRLAILRHMFTSSTATITCPGHSDFTVYTGSSASNVRSAYSRGDRAWCGWERFLGIQPGTCITPLSPFGSTVVAIAKPKSWFSPSTISLKINGNKANALSTQCTILRKDEFSVPRLVASIIGLFFFSAAETLSESTPFRLAGGGFGFAALSSLVVLFVLYKSIPHKKSFAASAVLFGSSIAAFVRFIFGSWIPSLGQLMRNPLVLAYTGLSGMMGLALTYYYNDVSNEKMNTILRVALEITGMALVGNSAASPEAAAIALLSMLAWKLLPLILQGDGVRPLLQRAKAMAQTDLRLKSVLDADVTTPVTARAPAGGRGLTVQVPVESLPPSAPVLAQLQMTPGTPAMTPGQPVSPLVHRGLILNVDTGKTIQIGKATYTNLVESGYVVDPVQGTIMPPTGRNSRSSSKRRRRSASIGRRK